MRGQSATLLTVLLIATLPLLVLGCKAKQVADTPANPAPTETPAEVAAEPDEHEGHDHPAEPETKQDTPEPPGSMDDASADDLLSKLTDGTDGDKIQALSQAGMIQSATERDRLRDVVRSLVEAPDTDDRVRAPALRFWAFYAANEPEPALACVEDSNPAVRVAAVDALKMSNSPEIFVALKALKNDPDASVAAAAADALGTVLLHTKSAAAVDQLMADLGHPEGDLSAQAAMKLEQKIRADRSVVDQLMVGLRELPNPAARASCATIMGMSCAGASEGQRKYAQHLESIYRATALPGENYTKPVPVLMERLVNDPDPAVREACAEALGCIGDPRAAPALGKALHDTDHHVRRRAASALVIVPPGRAIEDLIAAARYNSEPSAAVRRFAVEALASQATSEAAMNVTLCLNDPDAEVRRYAAETLGRIGTHLQTTALIDCFDDDDDEVRWKAVEAVAKFGDPEAREALTAALWDPSPQVALAAQNGLHTLGIAKDMPTRDEREIMRRARKQREQAGEPADGGEEVPESSDEAAGEHS